MVLFMLTVFVGYEEAVLGAQPTIEMRGVLR